MLVEGGIFLGLFVDWYRIVNFFSEATTMGTLSVVTNGDLLKKVNIPKYLIVDRFFSLCFDQFRVSLLVMLSLLMYLEHQLVGSGF